MIAAKLRHKDLVSSVLRSTRFDGNDDMDFLAELIHSRNASGQTLLAMVALQGLSTKDITYIHYKTFRRITPFKIAQTMARLLEAFPVSFKENIYSYPTI